MKTAVVLGGGGFIGGHLAKRLKSEGYWVRCVDIKPHEYFNHEDICDDFIVGDLRNFNLVKSSLIIGNQGVDEVYQLAADMGGAGYIFTGENDADIMHNSSIINLNVLKVCSEFGIDKILYTSSACVYPEHNQLDPDNPNCEENSAYPANPDSEYGWEKLYSERLYQTFRKNYGIDTKIARLHNIFGPMGTYDGGREKAPAAICRKVVKSNEGDTIEVWGDGKQTRSFLYVDECVEGLRRLMESEITIPLNVGSEEMISINDFTKLIISISGKDIKIKNINGPLGVRGRNSDNKLIKKLLGWEPTEKLETGIKKLYQWLENIYQH
jgi:nucleoside-diphosphate-sugar epimerase